MKRSVQQIREFLIQRVSEHARIAVHEVDVRESVANYDLNSLALAELMTELEDYLELELSNSLLWSTPSIEALANHLGDGDRRSKASSGEP